MSARREGFLALRYGLLALPVAALGLPFYIHVPVYLAETLGYGYAAVGLCFLLARVTDVLTDLPVGAWIDRHGFSRRLLAGGLALAVAVVAAVLWLPHPLSVITLTGLLCLLLLAWTLITVPWLSLPVQLGVTDELRLRLNSSRELFLLIGTLLALVAPALITGAVLLWALVGVAALLAAFIVLLPTPPRATGRRPVSGMQLLREPAVRRLALPWFVNALANAIPGTVLLVFVREVLGAEDLAGAALGTYFLAAVCGMPLWYALARRIGERAVWRITILLAAVAFAFGLLLGRGDSAGFLVICVITGLAVGGDQAMPASLQTALAQRLAARHGGETGARMLALWSLINKAAMGLAVAISFSWLGAHAVDGQAPAWAISTAYIAFPVGLKLLALRLLHRGVVNESPAGVARGA